MRYRELGNTGIKVSEIAFGGVEIGMPYALNMSNAKHMMAKDEAIYLLNKSLDSGINFFDTARLYGESEAIMGEAFKYKRDKVILASKCRHFRDSNGFLPEVSQIRSFVNQSINESLEKLHTDYIDVYMLHYADLEILEIDEIKEVFQELIIEGKIRVPGVSVYEQNETKLALEKGFWKVIQLPFNLMDQKHAVHFDKADQLGVGIVVRSVLMRGLLTERSFNLHPELKQVQDHVQQYKQLYSEHMNNLPSLAMKFAASINEVSSVLVGIDKIEFLEEAIKVFDGNYFSDKQLEKAKSLNFPNQSFLNLAQWDKNGWL
ncbi:aldo/keto reductase [Sphingobacterium daejeonense]|uniref:Aldo/keto reductase n=1 Tax=Sphingobacterium daejeonense TaxID=371142 RepID=A0ABW3RM11_9SPHI